MRVVCSLIFFFFKQKTAYELRISDWSSDVCSSDLGHALDRLLVLAGRAPGPVMRILLRVALIIGAISGLELLGLLAWSTGNASRFARYYDILLVLNGIFAMALFVWVVALTTRLSRPLRRPQLGATLTKQEEP